VHSEHWSPAIQKARKKSQDIYSYFLFRKRPQLIPIYTALYLILTLGACFYSYPAIKKQKYIRKRALPYVVVLIIYVCPRKKELNVFLYAKQRI
jgi:hypothetical protein